SQEPLSPEAPKARKTLEPVELTLLRTGNSFLAYVTVERGGTKEDLAGAELDFHYSPGDAAWSPVPGCSKVTVCDASSVVGQNGRGVRIRADFSQDGYEPASAVFSVPAFASVGF
ncbi:MAG: hypothetical protein AB1324_08430, partial [Candidatus Micrarchaeota archaeon]